MCDGNLAALNAYLKEQDELEARDNFLEQERIDVGEQMFDAYFGGNQYAEEYVDETIMDREEFYEPLLRHLRKDDGTMKVFYRELVVEVIDYILEDMDEDQLYQVGRKL